MNARLRLAVLTLLMLVSVGCLLAQDPPEPHPKGIINGLVTDDSTGLPIGEAVVRFFKPHGLWIERVHTDTSGYYEADLDTGRYFVRFEKFGYFPEWFDDAHEIRDAFIVNVHEDTSVTANAGLRPLRRDVHATVTGTVTDSANGNPLPNTMVAFLRPHRWLRQLQHLTEFFGGFPFERLHLPGLGRLHGVVWAGLTDSAGNYEAHLTEGFRYIAVAFKPGFLPQFFDHKLSAFDADRISIQGDTSGINFELLPNPLGVNTITGRVVDSLGNGLPAHVLLIRVRPNGWIPVRYAATDSTGGYGFHHLAPGKFLVRAIPVDGFAPAWYANGECGIRNWHNADVLNLISDINNVDVCVRPLRESGFCRIDGQLTGSSNLMAAASQEGVAVYAVSVSTGEVTGYDVTEADGSYSIDDLSPGTYTIVVDKEGVTGSSTPSVTVDETNGFVASGVGVGISEDPPLSVEDGKNIPHSFALRQNYPNPFNPSTEIGFDVAQISNVSIKVYNLIGQEIAELRDGIMQPGSYVARWDGRDYRGTPASSGIYFVKYVATPLSEERAVFIQIRKMTLLK